MRMKGAVLTLDKYEIFVASLDETEMIGSKTKRRKLIFSVLGEDNKPI